MLLILLWWGVVCQVGLSAGLKFMYVLFFSSCDLSQVTFSGPQCLLTPGFGFVFINLTSQVCEMDVITGEGVPQGTGRLRAIPAELVPGSSWVCLQVQRPELGELRPRALWP